MRPRTVLAALFLLAAGCNRQDADVLARIGDKLVTRAKTVVPVTSSKDKVTVTLPTLSPPSSEKAPRAEPKSAP